MKKMELDLPGSAELNDQEMKTLYGGKTMGPVWWALIWDAVNNFGDIREGWSDGINGKPPRY